MKNLTYYFNVFCFVGAMLATPLVSAASGPSPQPVSALDLGRYLGVWYQISHVPLGFEFGGQPCPCARQILTQSENQVNVENTCNLQTVGGQYIDLKGSVAYSDPANSPAKFTVTLQVTPTQTAVGAYWVIGIDPDYRFSVVTNDTGTSLYILSKTPTLDPALYDQAIEIAAQQQIDLTNLQPTLQKACSYP